MASEEAVRESLRRLWTAYTRYPPADLQAAAAQTWFNALRHVADNDLAAAIGRWIENEKNVPVPASILAMSDTEKHRRLNPPRQEEGGMAPHTEYPIEPGKAFGIIKEALVQIDHGAGVGEVIAKVQENYRDDFVPGSDAKTYGCLRCNDNRFISVGKPTDWIVRPCEACNGRAYERWAKGHFLPNHTCPECEDVHRGRRSRSNDE